MIGPSLTVKLLGANAATELAMCDSSGATLDAERTLEQCALKQGDVVQLRLATAVAPSAASAARTSSSTATASSATTTAIASTATTAATATTTDSSTPTSLVLSVVVPLAKTTKKIKFAADDSVADACQMVAAVLVKSHLLSDKTRTTPFG